MLDEKKPHRPVPEIQNEYSNTCARAGHIQYQIATLKKDLDIVNDTLRDLNFEAAASGRAEKEATTKALEQPKEEAQTNG